MDFSAILTGYRLLNTLDLMIKCDKFIRDKNNLIYFGFYNGYLDNRINALRIVINERNNNNE